VKRVSNILLVALVSVVAWGVGSTHKNPATVSAATAPTTQGRYAVTALNAGQYAVMVDTVTGKAWYLAFSEYCESPTGNLRTTSYSAGCKDSETATPPVPEFEEVSVQGLYTSPVDPVRTLMRQSK
jgi:hypothetical protein